MGLHSHCLSPSKHQLVVVLCLLILGDYSQGFLLDSTKERLENLHTWNERQAIARPWLKHWLTVDHKANQAGSLQKMNRLFTHWARPNNLLLETWNTWTSTSLCLFWRLFRFCYLLHLSHHAPAVPAVKKALGAHICHGGMASAHVQDETQTNVLMHLLLKCCWLQRWTRN